MVGNHWSVVKNQRFVGECMNKMTGQGRDLAINPIILINLIIPINLIILIPNLQS